MRILLAITLVFIFVGMGLSAQRSNAELKEEAARGSKKEVVKKINWISFTEAIELNAQEPRKVIVDVYTDWCHWCKVMDKETFTDPQIIDYINEKYYAVKLDGEQKESIQIGDIEYAYVKNGRSYAHELAILLMDGKMAYPTVVFLDEKMSVLKSYPGYKKVQNMERLLKYYGENYHPEVD